MSYLDSDSSIRVDFSTVIIVSFADQVSLFTDFFYTILNIVPSILI